MTLRHCHLINSLCLMSQYLGQVRYERCCGKNCGIVPLYLISIIHSKLHSRVIENKKSWSNDYGWRASQQYYKSDGCRWALDEQPSRRSKSLGSTHWFASFARVGTETQNLMRTGKKPLFSGLRIATLIFVHSWNSRDLAFFFYYKAQNWKDLKPFILGTGTFY